MNPSQLAAQLQAVVADALADFPQRATAVRTTRKEEEA